MRKFSSNMRSAVAYLKKLQSQNRVKILISEENRELESRKYKKSRSKLQITCHFLVGIFG